MSTTCRSSLYDSHNCHFDSDTSIPAGKCRSTVQPIDYKLATLIIQHV
ncbi:hypothetical protein EYC95_26310 [Pseudomonas sp. BGI-2]|nr:hypothetical protein EYC95_26310 [Pseudomonas sp. BGI-2]